jgi:hypothetical protein
MSVVGRPGDEGNKIAESAPYVAFDDSHTNNKGKQRTAGESIFPVGSNNE